MKPQCPKCSAVLQEDYGMVSCPSCGKFLFVDMDGVAHMGNEATRVGAPLDESATAPAAEEEPPFAFTSEAMDVPTFEVPSFDAPMDVPVTDLPPYEPPQESSSESESWASPEPDPMGEFDSPTSAPNGEPGDFNMDGLLGYPGDDQQVSVGLSPSDEPGPANDPLGISGYANSEISQAKDGLLVFKILISGIDSKEIRESLREAIEDVRFGWDPNTIMARILRGTLEIESVSPVKATILVNRIKRLPIKIRWEQYAITQIDDV